MKRMSIGILALAIALYATPALHAQGQPTEGIRFGFGVGPTLPIGTYGDVDKMGYHVLGALQLPISQSPVHLRIDVLYGQTSHDVGSGSTSLFGGTVSALYHLGDRHASARPYILGGLGLYNVDAGGATQSKIAYGFGGGLLFGLSGLNAFVEARYMSVQTSGSSLSFIPITVGLMFK
jgi:hypothetical protein